MCRKRYRAAVVALALLALMSAFAARADFEAGEKAWAAGDTAGALAQWSAAAEAGDRRAMLMLGRIHAQGLGVLQNYVEAHKWLNLAASRGEADAVGERDAVAARMTPEQISRAQDAAWSWRPGGAAASSPTPASTAAAPAAVPPASTESIREAQRLLSELGYAPGPADGQWGARTASAYRSFLSDAGLPAAERLTADALRAMRERAKADGASGTAAAPPADATAPGTEAPSEPSSEPLSRRVQEGDEEGVKQMLSEEVDADAQDENGWTALMHAVDQILPVAVDALLAAGVDMNVRNAGGATALLIAAARGHWDVVSKLLAAGADPSIAGADGRTPAELLLQTFGSIAAARRAGVDEAVIALAEEAERGGSARRLAPTTPGVAFRDCPTCPEMMVLPGGTFTMGSPGGEEGRDDDEGPQHSVTIASFAVGRTEVTVGEYARYVEESGASSGGGCWTWEEGEVKERAHRSWRDPGYGQGTGEPVVCVSWEDAKGYVEWFSRKTGAPYRLLTEAEWEYAARAGTRTARPWGDSPSSACGYANVGDETLKGHYGDEVRWEIHSCHDGRVHTAPIGSYEANGFKLHDMLGNVWEWVEDCWHDSYSGAPSDGRAWTSGGDCSKRVLRGGSWYYRPVYVRSASRDRYVTGIRGFGLGFRIARTLP